MSWSWSISGNGETVRRAALEGDFAVESPVISLFDLLLNLRQFAPAEEA
jgi:hypothetical protein